MDDGARPTPNMWLGAGGRWCSDCKTYTRHYAVSHPDTSDCYEICETCNQYHGSNTLKNIGDTSFWKRDADR